MFAEDYPTDFDAPVAWNDIEKRYEPDIVLQCRCLGYCEPHAGLVLLLLSTDLKKLLKRARHTVHEVIPEMRSLSKMLVQ